MATTLNINGSDDPSYRYKMPKLVGKIEGRGNGIKTVIVNCSDIAQALHRPTAQVTKFFGCELGAMSRYEEKADRAIVNGAFETADLQEHLFKYIQKFVLCGSCHNPETNQVIKGKKKSAVIWLHCIACGADSEADNAHKLCTAIIKDAAANPDTSTRKKDRKKKDKKDDGEAGGDGDEESVTGSISSADKRAKKKKNKKEKKEKKSKKDKKAKKEKKEKKKAAAAAAADSASSTEDEDGDDGNDLAGQMDVLTIADAAALEDSVEKLRAAVAENPKMTSDDVVKKVLEYQTNCALRKIDAIAIMYYAVVADQPPTAINKYMDGLALLAQTEEHQLEVLSCVEESVARAEDDAKRSVALKIVPLVIKALYDESVVEEEVIRKWHKGVLTPKHVRVVVDDATADAVKKNAAPIVTWLETVEEDSDDEDSDDEDGDEDEDDDAVATAAAASAPDAPGAEANGNGVDTSDPSSIFGSVNVEDDTDSESDTDDDDDA
ncbi:Eukaryotic translation initiation factor 5 [Hondaea fermentalgiana]|uniref:Eukaryotic translation initiation factor 5 n=1 Tax=Hondaea fermentalgiana TaxID=2315210 RepID=A0A2R5G6A5_9STRA|nr:Eukaryotic translation initiation factor 5 [Hondaea fermentalgiana]|eukprot:GBG26576.1 Eukaryotic translation initiation factor 5 [Hondaea fermentalgiana]